MSAEGYIEVTGGQIWYKNRRRKAMACRLLSLAWRPWDSLRNTWTPLGALADERPVVFSTINSDAVVLIKPN